MVSIKICNRCKQSKESDDFVNSSNTKSGKTSYCKECAERDRTARRNRKRKYWSEHNPYSETREKKCVICEETLLSNRFSKNYSSRDGLDTRCKHCISKLYQKNIAIHMINHAKHRARLKNIEFAINLSDIIIPKLCPVLGTPITIGNNRENSPSIDRVDNSKGYTKDNIIIISYRANKLKNDATIQELEKVCVYMRDNGINNSKHC